MTAIYEKLNLKSFKEALASGRYESATSARRAVGKATTFTDGEKAAARRAIDAKYGPGPSAAPAKKAAKKVVLAPKSAVKTKGTRRASAGKVNPDKATPLDGILDGIPPVEKALMHLIHEQDAIIRAKTAGLPVDQSRFAIISVQISELVDKLSCAAIAVVKNERSSIPEQAFPPPPTTFPHVNGLASAGLEEAVA